MSTIDITEYLFPKWSLISSTSKPNIELNSKLKWLPTGWSLGGFAESSHAWHLTNRAASISSGDALPAFRMFFKVAGVGRPNCLCKRRMAILVRWGSALHWALLWTSSNGAPGIASWSKMSCSLSAGVRGLSGSFSIWSSDPDNSSIASPTKHVCAYLSRESFSEWPFNSSWNSIPHASWNVLGAMLSWPSFQSTASLNSASLRSPATNRHKSPPKQ